MTDDKATRLGFDPATVPARTGSTYPAVFKAAVAGRARRPVGVHAGLTHYGVNIATLPPGTASGQRHWHSHEDEFVYILSGTPTLVSDAGEQVLSPGMCAGFKAGVADGHQLVNRTDRDVIYFEVGSRSSEDTVVYSDIDMILKPLGNDTFAFVHRNGEPY